MTNDDVGMRLHAESLLDAAWAEANRRIEAFAVRRRQQGALSAADRAAEEIAIGALDQIEHETARRELLKPPEARWMTQRKSERPRAS